VAVSAYARAVSFLRVIVVGLLLVALCVPVASAQEPSESPIAAPGGGAGTESGTLVPFVPVRRFWSSQRDIPLQEVVAAIEGRSDEFKRVVVATDDAEALWSSMGVQPASATKVVGTVQAVKQALNKSRRTLGLVPAARVHAGLRALSVDGQALFGSERVADLAGWPLMGADAGEGKIFDPEKVWTLMAGGDVMLDREPHRQALILGKGVDHVWDGGVAEIASRTCCTFDGGPAITTARVAGTKGAVRELLAAADLAVVNHEAPAPNRPTYHPSGLTFNVDPRMLEGVADAGIDAVSLANNHIRNDGSTGVTQTVLNVRRAGMHSFGAGIDEDRAREPLCFDQGGTRVCLLGYNEVDAASNSVRPGRAGAAELITAEVKADIQAAHADGADVIVVWPHWGREYVTTTEAKQRRWAREMVRAGADVVLGNHSHVVGPIQFIGGSPVFYSLGNLIFDLPRFESTEEGVLVELVFHGSRLMQIELHPTVVHRRAQLNLLERDGDGAVVIGRMREASLDFE